VAVIKAQKVTLMMRELKVIVLIWWWKLLKRNQSHHTKTYQAQM